jgi:hypothetical protein
VDSAQIGALDKRARWIGFRKYLIEVVRCFRFELEQRQDVHGKPRANTRQIRIRLANSEKFSENSNLDVVESA